MILHGERRGNGGWVVTFQQGLFACICICMCICVWWVGMLWLDRRFRWIMPCPWVCGCVSAVRLRLQDTEVALAWIGRVARRADASRIPPVVIDNAQLGDGRGHAHTKARKTWQTRKPRKTAAQWPILCPMNPTCSLCLCPFARSSPSLSSPFLRFSVSLSFFTVPSRPFVVTLQRPTCQHAPCAALALLL